jgi:hypothetical protein
MKILVTCAVCVRDLANAPSIGGLKVLSWATVTTRDDGAYDLVCPRGHPYVATVHVEKYSLLFELGLHAILDGYHREAVSAFSAALERFYEYYIQIVCRTRNISQTKLLEAWKSVDAQSERQLGAFVFVYLLENGTAPSLLSSNMVKFRNRVIHKGFIPDEPEALRYGEAVLSLLRDYSGDLESKYGEAIAVTAQEAARDRAKHTPGLVELSSLNFRTTIDLKERVPKGIATALRAVEARRDALARLPSLFEKLTGGKDAV